MGGSLDKLFHIISSCPLIEKLSLCHVHGDGLQTDYLHKLTSLVLKYVNFNTVFLADLSSKFPSLKDLTLYVNKSRAHLSSKFQPLKDVNKGREEIIISLERLHLNMGDHNHEFSSKVQRVSGKVQRVRLDVPSIRKLTFECSSIPKLSARSNSRGWESQVSVTRRKCLRASWFYRLSKLINNLMLSRISSLSLHVCSRTTFDYEGGEIRGLPSSEVENLDIYHEQLPTLSCYALFDGLFRMCHPKVITQYMYSLDDETNSICFLGKGLLDAKFPIPANQFMYGLNDLKEARIQIFDQEWRDEEPLDALSNYCYYSTTPEEYRPIVLEMLTL